MPVAHHIVVRCCQQGITSVRAMRYSLRVEPSTALTLTPLYSLLFLVRLWKPAGHHVLGADNDQGDSLVFKCLFFDLWSRTQGVLIMV